jgi:hypothetical protein
MPTITGTITDLISGDFRPVPWTITNVPAGGAISKAWFTVKALGAETVADPGLFQKIITTVLDTSKGHITSDGAGTGVATGFFYLLESETILMTPGEPYVYDMQFQITMTDLTLRLSTPEKGSIQTIQGVTNATA